MVICVRTGGRNWVYKLEGKGGLRDNCGATVEATFYHTLVGKGRVFLGVAALRLEGLQGASDVGSGVG